MKILIKCDEAVVPAICQALDGFVEECQQAIKKKWLYKIAKRVSKTGGLMMQAAVTISYEKTKDGVTVEVPLLIPTEAKVFGKKVEAKKLKSMMVDNISGYLMEKDAGKFTMEVVEG